MQTQEFVSVWGGEDGGFDPATGVTSVPEYGKVFISIRSTTGQNLTDTEKTQLVNDFGKFKVHINNTCYCKSRNYFIILNTTFQYNSNVTTKTQSDLETLINTTISNYNSDNLQDFNKPFRHSQLTGLIDDTDGSILSNVTTVTLAKFVTPDTTKQLHIH